MRDISKIKRIRLLIWLGIIYTISFLTFGNSISSYAEETDTKTSETDETETKVPEKTDDDFPVPVLSDLTVYKDPEDYSMVLAFLSDQKYEDYKVNVYLSVGNNTSYQLVTENKTVGSYYNSEKNFVSVRCPDIVPGIQYYYAIMITSYTPGSDYMESYDWGYAGYKTITKNSPVYEFPVYVENMNPSTIDSVAANDKKGIDIEFTGIGEVDGFRLYRSITSGSGYTLIADIPYDEDLYYNRYTYTDTDVPFGYVFYYVVCPYVVFNGAVYEGPVSNELYAVAPIDATKITKATSPKKNTNVIKWKKVKEATGYKVCVSDDYFGESRVIATLGADKTKFTHKKVPHGKGYYYTVVAFAEVNGVITEHASNPYYKSCNYYGCENESYSEKCQRIFGKNYYKDYKSAAEASKHMKTIRIKVWDISGGKKVTRTFPLTVNKKIAPTVQRMFNEIYRSKERIPIHSIGAYSYRGGRTEHDEGLAIDINPDENYMIDNGKILAGSFWNPKKSPYSIPLKCEFVNIMRKYGFYRGFWGNRKDYMHFSYFGT